jgi:hypothetical protein
MRQQGGATEHPSARPGGVQGGSAPDDFSRKPDWVGPDQWFVNIFPVALFPLLYPHFKVGCCFHFHEP